MADDRLYAPATQRNREPIVAVLRRHLPAMAGRVLELASGSGEHVVHFAQSFPNLGFQPSDLDQRARASVDAWAALAGCRNVAPAIELDASGPDWPEGPFDAVLCINMIHISPWAATVGLMRGAARAVVPGGVLYIYGPFLREGRHTAPSNAAFDRSLRQQNPAWGVRDLEAVTGQAQAEGWLLAEVQPMPANNLSVVFRRPRRASPDADGAGCEI